jgi:hypothetical protein
MKFEELDSVKTLCDFPEEGIKKGEAGTVVAVFTNPNEAYEIEFCFDTGETKSMFAILPQYLELDGAGLENRHSKAQQVQTAV